MPQSVTVFVCFIILFVLAARFLHALSFIHHPFAHRTRANYERDAFYSPERFNWLYFFVCLLRHSLCKLTGRQHG